MDDKSLWGRVNMTLVEVAPIDTFATAVTTPADMELKLSEVWHLMIGIEWAQEHQ